MFFSQQMCIHIIHCSVFVDWAIKMLEHQVVKVFKWVCLHEEFVIENILSPVDIVPYLGVIEYIWLTPVVLYITSLVIIRL